jgi:hypothetical protein
LTERFTNQLPTLVASAFATGFWAFAGPYINAAGTLTGVTAGSLAIGTVTWWAERLIRRAHDLARLKAAAIRRNGKPLDLAETQHIQALVDHKHRWRWRPIGVAGGLTVVVSASVIGGWELAAGAPVRVAPPTTPVSKPVVHTVIPVRHRHHHHRQPVYSPPPAVQPSESPSVTITPSPSATPTVMPSASPTVSAAPSMTPA